MKQHDHEQNTPEWHAARIGLPTASNAGKMITGTGKASEQLDAYAMSLAADMFCGKAVDHWEGNRYTERGHEVEAEAAKWYAYKRDVSLIETGFCTDDLGRYGASPDRLIEGGGVLEIKCLPKEHVACIVHWHTKRTAPPKFLPQTHMEAFVCEQPWTDLLFYHSDLPKVIIRINRDSTIDALLKSQINKVIVKRDLIVKQLQEMDS